MERFSFGEQSIAFTRSGRGEPVLFLHNGGTSHAIWREVMPLLPHQVIAMDLLGYGASSRPERCTLEMHAESVSALIDALGLAPVALVGNCMGSAISLTVARRRPRDIRALVLVNPLTEATYAAGGLGATLSLSRSPFGRPIARALSNLRLPRFVGARLTRFQLGARGRAEGISCSGELADAYTAPGQMRSLVSVLDDMASYSELDRFTPPRGFPPICTIWGMDNRVLSPLAGRQLNATLEPFREEWLEGCGHLPMLEQPQVVARIVAETLRQKRRAVS
jgi:pimeloyl-ACP methyl ester carboxylesterase